MIHTLHNLVAERPRLGGAINAVRARAVRARPALLTCATLFLLSLALRLYRLDAQSLWLDEGITWSEVTGRSGKGWLTLLAELFSPNAGYPLYHLLLKAWVALAGDSEWALRFPSALAGAAVVVAVYLAALEVIRSRSSATGSEWRVTRLALLPAAFVALSPFALWHAQDAKAYSLLLLVAALQLWALLRALHREDRDAWLLVLALALVSIFVHRLALLGVSGAALAFALTRETSKDEGQGTKDERRGTRERSGRWSLVVGRWSLVVGRWSLVVGRWSFLGGRWLWLALAGACGALGVAGTILAARGEAAGAERAGVGPLAGLGLVFSRFALDRWPGDVDGFLGLPTIIWLLPFVALTLLGLALLGRDAAWRSPVAIALLCALIVPLALFGLTLALAPVFQARYAVVAFPAWVIALAYPLLRRTTNDERRTTNGQRRYSASFGPFVSLKGRRWPALGANVLLGLALAASIAMLLQPGKGLFSGAPVKEQWREAVTALAFRAHPDDLLIVQPYYVLPLYDYYAPRVTPDPLQRPVTFPIFGEGDRGGQAEPTRAELLEFVRRRYEPFFNQQARGTKRALLLIAPDHARTVDPPPTPADEFGWLGLRFEYPQRTWPCGGAEYVGVALMCQSFPETFRLADDPVITPEPASPLAALFGSELRLRGSTLAPFGGALRAGGSLPVTLFWEAAAPPTQRYRMFLHLCRECEQPPPANDDGPPLMGYPPAGDTTTWRVGDPVHDERAIRLPHDLPPGRYTLLLGVYPEGQPTVEARLPIITDAPVLPAGRLVLGEVEIAQP